MIGPLFSKRVAGCSGEVEGRELGRERPPLFWRRWEKHVIKRSKVLIEHKLRSLHAPSAISLSVSVESCSIVVDRGNPVRYGNDL